MNTPIRLSAIAIAAVLAVGSATPLHAQNPNTLLNVSYDIARELYVEINAAFIKHYPSSSTTRRKPERTSPSINRTTARHGRRARSSRAWKPMW
jgi:ABC-type sulfate transport system substrate-binding protein